MHAQMGSGRAGWYSWDGIDNGGTRSSTTIEPRFQTVGCGDIMHQREVLAAGGATWSETTHVVLGGVTVFLMFLAIGTGAAAFGKRLRLYSIATIVVFLVFGGLTFLEAPRLQADLPTPWIGLRERINISVFLL